MITYKKELIEAIKRSELNKISIDDFFIESNISFLSEKNKIKLKDYLDHNIYSKPIEEIAFHCLDLNFHHKSEIDEILNCSSLITIGYVDYLTKSAFKTSVDEIQEWFSESPEFRTADNIHVWLTLPSLEIIDITIAASFIKINSDFSVMFKDYRNCLKFLPEEKFNLNTQIPIHRPQFVGIDFLYKTGMAKDWQKDENGNITFS